MKTPSHPSVKHGFTLIELLVVIAIIAVLSAVGFAGGTAAMNKARKVSAQAGATSIATAIDQFYAEYSALPDPTGTSSVDTPVGSPLNTASGDGVKLLNILAGLDTGDQNPRKIRFLSGKEAKNRKDGIEYSSDGKTIDGMYDPWSRMSKETPYYILLDYDYDERLIVNPATTPSSPSVTLNGRRAVVYSLGVANGASAKTSTVVKTW